MAVSPTSMRNFCRARRQSWTCALALICVQITASSADTVPRLGRALTAAQANTVGISIFPDGRGLPRGSGTANVGKILFAQHCASCHGIDGRGGSGPELVGGTAALTAPDPDKTIALYWPYATTLFDTIWRSMPPVAPGSLSANDTYAITAYLLFSEGQLGATTPLTDRSLPLLRMPNAGGFRPVETKH